ncbi:hypothetical protein [Scytonema sp. NUACC21]
MKSGGAVTITAGVTWVLSLLNPASAFVRACKLIIDVIMFFVERGSQIAALVNAVLDSVSAIADGAIGTAAKLVEGALSKALPVVISFLASLIGLGGVSGKVRGLLEKARGLIDTAINWVLSKVSAFAKKLGGKLGKTKFGQKVKAGAAKTKDLNARGIKKVQDWKDKGKAKLQDLKERGKKKLQDVGNKLGFSKDKGKDNKERKDGKLQDGEIGQTIKFNAKGKSHRLWVQVQGNKPAVMVASTPTPVEAFLRQEFVTELEKKQSQAKEVIASARVSPRLRPDFTSKDKLREKLRK